VARTPAKKIPGFLELACRQRQAQAPVETSGEEETPAATGCMNLELFQPSIGLRRASEHWCICRDGNHHCLAMSRRHYSARNYRQERQPLFAGPGRKVVLLSEDCTALFVWRKFIDGCQPAQTGINCAIFRNEGDTLSSLLIREAVQIVWEKWGHERLYTLVNAARVRSTNPGFCFLSAGWAKCGVSKTGKIILELLPLAATAK